jgi:hypothetical protein
LQIGNERPCIFTKINFLARKILRTVFLGHPVYHTKVQRRGWRRRRRTRMRRKKRSKKRRTGRRRRVNRTTKNYR